MSTYSYSYPTFAGPRTRLYIPGWAWVGAGMALLLVVADIGQTLVAMDLAKSAAMNPVSIERDPILSALGGHTVIGIVVARLLEGITFSAGILWLARRSAARRVVLTVLVTVLAGYFAFDIVQFTHIPMELAARSAVIASHHATPKGCVIMHHAAAKAGGGSFQRAYDHFCK